MKWIAWISMTALTVLALVAMRPPAPAPANAPATSFSAYRAISDVNVIAQRPHPLGTPQDDAVRQYLMTRLASLGMQPAEFDALGVLREGTEISAGRTKDIVARLPGASDTRAVVLMAHYDSAPQAPGAGDDGAAVAAILETVRALRTGPPLRNELIVVFTDGEEAGLLGAEAFAYSNPLRTDIGVLLNFDARGDRGTSLLFETSAGNRDLVNAAKSAPFVVGSSLFYPIYARLLPNDTDFSMFRPYGTPGLNFAFGAGFSAYHTRLDTPANLSLRSLQHDGDYALSLTRKFGGMDLTRLDDSQDAVFFDLYGGRLIVYPQRWVIPLQCFATVLLFAALVQGFRRGVLTAEHFLKALPAAFAALILGPLELAALAWSISHYADAHIVLTDSLGNVLVLCGWVAAALAVVSFCTSKADARGVSAAGLMLVCALSWAVALTLPAGSYLLLWPLVAGTVGFLFIDRGGAFMGAAVAVLIFAPIAYLLLLFLSLAVALALAIGALVSISLLLSAPLAPRSSAALGVTLLLGLAACALGLFLSRPSAAHPRPDDLMYVVNGADGSAKWISRSTTLDAWTQQLFHAATRSPHPLFAHPVYTVPAALSVLAPPLATVSADSSHRHLHISISSPGSAQSLVLNFSFNAPLTAVTVSDRRIATDQNPDALSLWLYGMGADPVAIDLDFSGPASGNFYLFETSRGLPPVPIAPRPDRFIADYWSDTTWVFRQYRF